jgi:uncharacterized membrane protein
MSEPSITRQLSMRTIAWTVVTIALVLGTAPFVPRMIELAARSDWRPHAPDMALWMSQPIAIKIHMTAALAALAIGIVIMMRPKGKGLHKALGWSWVVAMAVTAVSSFVITTLGSTLSWLHLLSGWTVISLPMAVYAIRRRDIRWHAGAMTGMFVGGLIIAGAFNFLPGRLMWRMIFG